MAVPERADAGELGALPFAAICALVVVRGSRSERVNGFAIAPGRLLTCASVVAGADGVEIVASDGAGLSLAGDAVTFHPQYRPGNDEVDLALLQAPSQIPVLPLHALQASPANGFLLIGYGVDPPSPLRARAAPGRFAPSGRTVSWTDAPLVAAGAAICVEINAQIYAAGVHLGARGGCLLQEEQVRWALSA